MRNFFTLIVAMLLTAGSLQAEQIFVLFDGTCGDRVKYEQSVAQQPRLDYYAYHFSFQGGDRLLLETGAEGTTVQNFLPQGYIYCGDPRLSLELANRVNGGVDRVFILLPTANNQYIIQPVIMASVLQRNGASFSYFSPLTGFQFDTENGIIGENLAVDNEGAKVYFEGRETSPCAGYFLFRQLKVGASYPVIDYKISPEIGVFERSLGSDGISTTGGTIVAREVNGMPVANYLSSVCASATTIAQNTANTPAITPPAYGGTPQPQAYGTQQPAPPQPYYTQPQEQQVQPESVAYGTASQQPSTTVTTVNHTVAKGETLYAVSRKYNTTVDAVKTANGLTSNTLFPGQQLAITTTMSVPANEVAMAPAPTVPTTPYNAGNVAYSNPGAAQPTPYSTTPATPQAYGAQQTARSGQAAVYGENLHIVQPGETVASIALRYGYTSAKFREMNDIGANEVVRIGQQLKTTDCNCPVQEAAPAEAAPAAYGQPAATPQSYSQPAATPQAYGQPATASPQAYGNESGTAQPATPAYRTPQGYQAPQSAPVPATTTPKVAAPTTITNNPNFGQVVPNASAPPSSTMGQLEARGSTAPAAQPTNANPATYNAYPAPAPAPTQYQSPNPVPNAYGTPVGVNTQPAAQPTNRAFHLVQEGESLYSIARRYGITTNQLRALNNLDNGSVIVPFQKLYVN
ncbi:LysM peptidoglycan-binding domain-containing protein [Neolewinella aurantiaca]|uniref:LysM peptidoglycan-binding domain-containing protein n=1 Tax=Neolewinella aurantiaca TaxID=2602767 RepID=A0A5C7G0L1_9BACT|nr:LysM peptidoglycan-binding domain-containing protein [Neolewinella aurantiaca]TXF91255.1 LysM peptidoglycan-binding domain-containing protein [Neolewinella aurantiaca]